MALLNDNVSITAKRHDQVKITCSLQMKHPLDWPRDGVEISIYPTKGSETSTDAFRCLLSLEEAKWLYGEITIAIMDFDEIEEHHKQG